MIAKNHKKRDEIMGMTSQLFRQQGFDSTVIKQVIDNAGTFNSHIALISDFFTITETDRSVITIIKYNEDQ